MTRRLWTIDEYQPTNELLSVATGAITRTATSEEWTTGRRGVWFNHHPPSLALTRQGWKVHISATPSNAMEVLDIVSGYCGMCTISFKHILDHRLFVQSLSKNWNRTSSGKFITLYPSSDDDFAVTVEELAEMLREFDGPRIISDYQHPLARCVHFRFGVMYSDPATDEHKETVLVTPDGSEIPDIRGFAPVTPPWAALPKILQSNPDYAEKVQDGPIRIGGGRYEFIDVIQQNPTGSTYIFHDHASGSPVVVKEARGWMGWTASDRDAVAALRHEASVLREISGSNAAACWVDEFDIGDNHYLVESLVSGRTIRSEAAQFDSPIIANDFSVAARALYGQKAAQIWQSATEALARIHRTGFLIGDVNPQNIIVDPADLHTTFIDYEPYFKPGVTRSGAAGLLGYASTEHRSNGASDEVDDYFSIGMTLLDLIFPLGELRVLSGDTWKRLMLHIASHIGQLSDGVIGMIDSLSDGMRLEISEPIRRTLASGTVWSGFAQTRADPPTREAIASQVACAASSLAASLDISARTISDMAALGRSGQADSVLTLADGVTGIAFALAVSGYRGLAKDVMKRVADDETVNDLGCGFYDGVPGVMWMLLKLGMIDEFEELSKSYLKFERSSTADDDPSLFSGAAGELFAAVEFGTETGNDIWVHRADELARRLVAFVCRLDDGPILQQRSGLFYGTTGVGASLAAYAQSRTPAATIAESAKFALQNDLKWAQHGLRVGAMMPEFTGTQPGRLSPYLESGNLGVILANTFATQVFGWELDPLVQSLCSGSESVASVRSGLVNGLAGIVLATRMLPTEVAPNDTYDLCLDPWQTLWNFRVETSTTATCFPGEDLHAIASDLFNGSAGVVAAGQALIDGQINFPVPGMTSRNPL